MALTLIRFFLENLYTPLNIFLGASIINASETQDLDSEELALQQQMQQLQQKKAERKEFVGAEESSRSNLAQEEALAFQEISDQMKQEKN